MGLATANETANVLNFEDLANDDVDETVGAGVLVALGFMDPNLVTT
jgi:hypothetical protein